MKEKKFDEVTKLMQLFKDRHMLSLRLQLDYYEQMNSSNELTFKLENTKRRLIV